MDLQSIIAEIRAHPHALDFDRHDLGENLVYIAAEAILNQMGEEIDDDGQPWAPLSELYTEAKQRIVGNEPISVLYGHMRTLDQLQGLYRITPRTIDQVYGLDEEARDLAEWFQDPSPDRNQPPRRFYGFNAMALALLDQWVDAHFAHQIG